MDAVELRPLTLGEILDRTFTMYRRHFLFFVTLAGIFEIPTLAFTLYNVGVGTTTPSTFNVADIATGFVIGLASIAISLTGFVLGNGGAVLAISEFYLGHTITIGEALRRVFGRFWALLGAVLLGGIAILFAAILLVIPAIYLACCLLVIVPAVVIEKKGPGAAFSRSRDLTHGFVWRAFLIIVLYELIAFAIGLAAGVPAGYIAAASGKKFQDMQWLATFQAVLSTFITIFVLPILQIASSIFYFDLRVRKEAFDLQFMMNPDAPADDSRFLTEV